MVFRDQPIDERARRIDDLGFLQTSLEDIANNAGHPLEELQEMLTLIQTFHPVGVGARGLAQEVASARCRGGVRAALRTQFKLMLFSP